MHAPVTHRVVGTRQNGAVVTIWQGHSLDIAQRIMKLIRNGAGYRELRIEAIDELHPREMKPAG